MQSVSGHLRVLDDVLRSMPDDEPAMQEPPHEVRPNELIVRTSTFDGMPDGFFAGDMEVGVNEGYATLGELLAR